MPNIEFFGFDEEFASLQKAKIVKMFRGKPYLKHMVFSMHPRTKVVDQDDNPQPYMRITSTPNEDMLEIIEGLATLNLLTLNN